MSDDLFSTPPPAPKIGEYDLATYRQLLAHLAARGLYLGTSSWKYPGWNGLIYDEARYQYRGKFARTRFEQDCLAEYAETFSSVCVDAGYYQFPKAEYLAGLARQVPEGFQFAFKVTDDITLKRFPNVPRSGARAGLPNPNFLNAEMFRRLFLEPCAEFRSKIGPLIFEFSTFGKADFEHGRDFVAALDAFLGQLPKGWRYGVEIRNKGWLQPDYFAVLRSHGVAHVYNNWTRMPSVAEQMAIEGSRTADFAVARFLLKPGRTYEQAVAMFTPYEEIKERVDEAIGAAAKLLESSFELRHLVYIYINNRLEGSAPLTIAAILQFAQIVKMLMLQPELL